MAAIFFKMAEKMATIRYSCIKKIKTQHKIAHITRKRDEAIQKDKRKYQLPKADPGAALSAYPPPPFHDLKFVKFDCITTYTFH